MAQLVRDVLLLIFNELHNDLASLYACTLVNSIWCNIAVPLLWKYSTDTFEIPLDYKQESREKFYNIIAHFLPNNPKDPLPQNNIELPLNKFPKGPTFEYMNFFTRLPTLWIKDMAQLSINDNVEDYKYKKHILEQEIYKLIFHRCNNVNYFHWNTSKKLYRYPKAKSFFCNLLSLELNFDVVTSKTLFRIADICRNITNLEINECDEDMLGLVSLIKSQKNLQSLSLHFNDLEKHYEFLSKIISKKAATLKKVTIQPSITLISPIFIPSLKNIQYLSLDNERGDQYKNVTWNKWEDQINLASFPYLQYLETRYLPSNVICLIIEKSGKKILEINISNPLESNKYQIENMNLIRVISNNCPKLIKLTMNIDHKNLSEMSMIFSKCTQLERLNFTTNNIILPNGDELLREMSNVSLKALKEVSFGDKLNFSLKGLKSFFENWKSKNKFPIKFTHYYDGWAYSWMSDHDKMVEKYRNENVIS